MERLTIPDVRVDEHTTRRTMIDGEAVREHAIDFYWRLKAYEDTGLEPEAVERSKLEIEAGCVKAIARTYGIDINRLRKLAEADRDGRVAVLPCEVGDTVYSIFGAEVIEKTVGRVIINGYTTPRIWVDLDCSFLSSVTTRWDLGIGKDFFLTREEAEKALEAMKNE